MGETLSMSNNSLGDVGLAHLTSSLQNVPKLASLALRNINMGVAGAGLLAELLPQLKCMCRLDLSDNSIGDSGMEALAPALATSRLEMLCLRKMGLGAAGVVPLSGALEKLTSLRFLDLQQNEIGEAVETLILGLPAVRHLDLSGTRLRDAGAKVLAAVLPQGHPLETLVLSDNWICDAGVDALVPLLSSRYKLRHLTLDGNWIKPAGLHSLSKALPSGTLKSLSICKIDINETAANTLIGEIQKCNLHELLFSSEKLTPAVHGILGRLRVLCPDLKLSRPH